MQGLIYSVEDDENIARIICLTLQKQGYQVLSFPDGKSFRSQMKKVIPDLVILDLMLPDVSGLDLLKDIRSNPSTREIQVLILSARSQAIDKAEGLDSGADDYLEKPFDLLELISRVNVRFRRLLKSNDLTYGNVTINEKTHTCRVSNREAHLTNTEFSILLTLMKKHDEVVSRDELLSQLWGEQNDYESRTIDVHVNSLRKKLGKGGKKIMSVYGLGYRFIS